MTRWEYRTIFLPVPLSDNFQEYLNEVGAEGWEITSCTFVDGTNQKTYQGFRPWWQLPIRTPKPFSIFFLAKRAVLTD